MDVVDFYHVQVFDDVATELAMAILQFFSGQHPEEHIFRCMKGLLRFSFIAPSEVPMLIKMIGPDPAQFKGSLFEFSESISPSRELISKIEKTEGIFFRFPIN